MTGRAISVWSLFFFFFFFFFFLFLFLFLFLFFLIVAVALLFLSIRTWCGSCPDCCCTLLHVWWGPSLFGGGDSCDTWTNCNYDSELFNIPNHHHHHHLLFLLLNLNLRSTVNHLLEPNRINSMQYNRIARRWTDEFNLICNWESTNQLIYVFLLLFVTQTPDAYFMIYYTLKHSWKTRTYAASTWKKKEKQSKTATTTTTTQRMPNKLCPKQWAREPEKFNSITLLRMPMASSNDQDYSSTGSFLSQFKMDPSHRWPISDLLTSHITVLPRNPNSIKN